ncbi:MAG: hypothetical protein IPL79_09350 [Myxococcales bacterium]|nr:hypothetical protein [Myxococcales bacterium]
MVLVNAMGKRATSHGEDSATRTYSQLDRASRAAPLSGWVIALLSLDVALVTAGALLWLSR